MKFERCRVLTEAKQPVAFYGKAGFGTVDISGDLEVVPGEGAPYKFDFAAFMAKHRPDPELAKMFETAAIDYPNLKPVNAGSGGRDGARHSPAAQIPYPAIRSDFTFIQYAPKEGGCSVVFRTKQFGRKRRFEVPCEMRDRLGTALGSFTITGEVQRVTFRTEGENVRCFDLKPKNGYAVTVVPECPYHAMEVGEKVNLFGTSAEAPAGGRGRDLVASGPGRRGLQSPLRRRRGISPRSVPRNAVRSGGSCGRSIPTSTRSSIPRDIRI